MSFRKYYHTIKYLKTKQLTYKFYYDFVQSKSIKNYRFKSNLYNDNLKYWPLKFKDISFFSNNYHQLQIENNVIKANVFGRKIESEYQIWKKDSESDFINFNINYLNFLDGELNIQEKKIILDNHINYTKKNLNNF